MPDSGLQRLSTFRTLEQQRKLVYVAFWFESKIARNYASQLHFKACSFIAQELTSVSWWIRLSLLFTKWFITYTIYDLHFNWQLLREEPLLMLYFLLLFHILIQLGQGLLHD